MAEQICAVCCGTKREVEIDCPSSCSYLKASRSYESEKPVLDPQVSSKVRNYDESFIERYHRILGVVTGSVVEERMSSSWLVDRDVIEVFKSLNATMKTLSSGIYYESLPQTPARLSLFRRLKSVFDELMKPDPGAARNVLKVTEAMEVLDFLTLIALMNSSVRPKSRRYLDSLAENFGVVPPAQSSGLILP